MLHSPAIPDPCQREVLNAYTIGIMDVGACAARLVDRARDRNARRIAALDRYVEGWAEADVDKILYATGPGYRFTDPLVGSFSGRLLYEYFGELQCRFSRAWAIGKRDLAFFLRGPMAHARGLRFWREAPSVGLTGVAEIQVGERGVVAERVAYDGNLASDLLRRAVQ
jgi:hypothetical protein